MRKYLFNRVLRSIFSVIMVMLLSIVLIFSLYPLQKIIEEDADIESTKRAQGEDATKVKTLEVLEYYGYTNYVSLNDYCAEVIGDDNGPRFKTCISRDDTNEHKQNYLKKYRDLGWEEITLKEYTFNGEGKRTNADVVTRSIVENGGYQIKDGQKFVTLESNNFEPHPDDFLYESDGKTVVTYNNIIYFQKRRNPFSIFWSWFTNVINLDTKNTIESYVQYDPETDKFLTEDDSYEFEFGYYLGKNNDYNPTNIEYVSSEDDEYLEYSQITIQNDDLSETAYLSVGGISTGVKVDSGLEIKDAIVNKSFTNNSNHQDGGTLSIEVTFSDGSKKTISKDIKAFIQYDIPVYVGDDNVWYFGNTRTTIIFKEEIRDWSNGGKRVEVERELYNIEFMESAAKRGYKIQLDEYGAPALTCQGCEHKYKIYFDNTFPYIHFNFFNLSLGESIFFDKGKDVINLLFDNQGEIVTEDIVFPNGETKKASISSFHTCTYNKNEALNQYLFVDNYTKCSNIQNESSMIATSFIIGIFATLIAYFIGVPVGVLMSRFKDRVFDKVAMVYIIIMFSVPSLAYIYFFQVIATGLFDIEVVYKYGDVSTYILPIVSLSLGSIASMMMWTRRYMIDQGNSDYVKFARAKGLSESQIFFKHTLRNAIVPIAHGVPGSIIGAVAGALVTEEIYNVPGTGKLMVTAIKQYDNWIAIGLICFYSVLGIISMILGDIVITLVDPRISFVDTGGRK